MLEVCKDPLRIKVQELECALIGFSPSESFLEKFVGIVADCSSCNEIGGDKGRYIEIRHRLKVLPEKTSEQDDKNFLKYCLTLCYMCNYSSPRIFDFIDSLSQS